MNPYVSKPKTDKNISIPENILRNLLTQSELRMLKNRYQIMSLLEEGLSIRKVAERVKVGTDTVVRVARMIADRPRKKTIKTSTPWIFGKSND